MSNMSYESPKFSFQEMRLFERVADTCWGYSYAWFDSDGDGSIDEKERVKLSDLGLKDNGCQGNAARNALYDYWKNIPGVNLEKLSSAVEPHNNSPYVFKSNS